jgi:hypothetical protein
MAKFKPINVQEKLLFKAAKKPALRPKFNELLLRSDVFVIPLNRPAIWNGEAVKGQALQLLGYNASNLFFIAFFTSPERAAEANPQGMGVLKMAARDFFRITYGSYLVLNPNSAIGKEFVPAEISNILQQDMDLPPKLD